MLLLRFSPPPEHTTADAVAGSVKQMCAIHRRPRTNDNIVFCVCWRPFRGHIVLGRGGEGTKDEPCKCVGAIRINTTTYYCSKGFQLFGSQIGTPSNIGVRNYCTFHQKHRVIQRDDSATVKKWSHDLVRDSQGASN